MIKNSNLFLMGLFFYYGEDPAVGLDKRVKTLEEDYKLVIIILVFMVLSIIAGLYYAIFQVAKPSQIDVHFEGLNQSTQ